MCPEPTDQPDCLADLLARRARRQPDAPAILAPGRAPLTYGGLIEHVEDVVRRLNATGIGRADRVAVVLPNGPEMAIAFLAVAAGASCAPLNPGYREPEFEFYLSDLRARAIVLPAGERGPARTVARALSLPVIDLATATDGPAGLFSLETGADGAGVSAEFAGPEHEALVLHTSGTTSRPKIVPLRQRNLCASARNICASLALTPRDRCLNVMPLFHVHGLMAALLSSLGAGGSVVCSPGMDPTRFFDWLEEFSPTWYTAVPTMHQSALLHAARAGLDSPGPSLRFIRSCSSALPPQVMAELEALFDVPVLEAYGMTEASHQIACNPLPPGRRKPGSVGVATGTQITIRDAEGHELPVGGRGEITIRGPNVTDGYEANPAANRSAFTDGWFRTGDEGRLDPEGYLYITDRIKEIINRGGEKVSPREVDEVLMDHPAVAQAVTFAVPHPELGEDVVAAVVPSAAKAPADLELREFVAGRVAEHKVPRQVLVVDEIPKGPTGKMQRIGLAERLGHLLRADYAAPRTEMARALAELWTALLPVERVGLNDNFFLSGGSSLLAVEMLTRVGETLGAQVPLDEFFRRSTLADLARMVERSLGGREVQRPAVASIVVLVQPEGSRPPFFMAGLGLGWELRDLPAHLGPDQPLYGLRPTALLDRAGPWDARAIASRYVEALREVRPQGPYILGGGCAAGVVAFEMARQLTETGERVPLVVLFDVDFPPPRWMPGLTGVWLMRVPRQWARFRCLGPGERSEFLRRWAAVWWERARGRLGPGGAGPAAQPATGCGWGAGPEFEARLAPLRDDAWRYTPRPYPGRIAALLPTHSLTWPHHDRRLDWRRVALGGWEVRTIPGVHEDALREPHAAAAAEVLRACIGRALAFGRGDGA